MKNHPSSIFEIPEGRIREKPTISLKNCFGAIIKDGRRTMINVIMKPMLNCNNFFQFLFIKSMVRKDKGMGIKYALVSKAKAIKTPDIKNLFFWNKKKPNTANKEAVKTPV